MERVLREKVVQMRILPNMTVNEVVEQLGQAGCLGAGRLARAVDIYERMLEEGARVFFALSVPLTAAGFRRLISDMIRDSLVHGMVVTGTVIFHDVVETLGIRHLKGASTDNRRANRSLGRLCDIFLPRRRVRELRPRFQSLVDQIAERHPEPLGTGEFISELGKLLPRDRDSVVCTAAESGIPTFVPTLHELFAAFGIRSPRISIDLGGDLSRLATFLSSASRRGLLIVGGGAPKAFLLQAASAAGKPFNYAVQITMDRPEYGEPSGALLEEAASWGQISPNAPTVQAIGDPSIYLPVIVAAVLERIR